MGNQRNEARISLTLIALAAVCCLTFSQVDGRPQFTNLRVFSPSDLLAKDFWRGSVKSSKSNDDEELIATGRSGASFSSPVKRVSMAALLQQLQQAGQPKKSSPILLSPLPEDELKIEVKIDNPVEAREGSKLDESTKLKDSTIRRVMRPNGAVVYSRNLNGQAPDQKIIVKINPHLEKSTTTTTPTEATTTTTTTESSTTTTTVKPAKARDDTPVKTLRPYSSIISKKKSDGLIKASEGEKKLRSNSPIYYIKLPPNAFVPTPNRSSDSSFESEIDLKQIFVATTKRPGTDVTSTTEQPANLSTTTLKPGLTNSRIIRLKGPFVFNGKPGGIYSAPAPYRPPNYWDILHSLYPKLRRAQFIRR